MKCDDVLCTNASGEYFQGWLNRNGNYSQYQWMFAASFESINEYQEKQTAQDVQPVTALLGLFFQPSMNITEGSSEFIQISIAALQGWFTVPSHSHQNNFHGWVCCHPAFDWVCLHHPCSLNTGPLSPLQWVITDSDSNEISVCLIENGPHH